MELFDKYKEINNEYLAENFESARQKLVLLLDELKQHNQPYDGYINHMIRLLGLYPYIDCDTSLFEDRLAYELFKVNIGEKEPKVLHIEQSNVLKKLIEGKSIALSAPTSFGKSFIVDALISIKKPKIIMIIVPTIALTDEYRRRLQKKFGKEYKIITQYIENINLNEKNIFIFPQERALLYANIIDTIDLLIVDEFYKIEQKYDDRYMPLLKAIINFITIAKQKYFLMPNIDRLNNSFINDYIDEFMPIKFSTVYLKTHYDYKNILNEIDKLKYLLNIMAQKKQTLVYTSSRVNILNLCNDLINEIKYNNSSDLANKFSKWFKKHYSYPLYSRMFKYGIGIHSGSIHRSIGQIQLRLFEQRILHTIISTSSIIEGVNTTAENVVIWNAKIGNKHLNPLTYKNIIGRAGRMFKYFVGHIYILDKIKEKNTNDIELNISTENISVDGLEPDKYDFLPEDINNNIKSYINEIIRLIGRFKYTKYFKYHNFLILKVEQIYNIIKIIQNNSSIYNQIKSLYYHDKIGSKINKLLYYLDLKNIIQYNRKDIFPIYMNNIVHAWDKSIPELINNISCDLNKEFTLNNFFDCESTLTYNITNCFADLNIIFCALSNEQINLSTQIKLFGNAYLPPLVYQLEEYGLPRVISKNIHNSNIINFNDIKLDISQVLNILKDKKKTIYSLKTIDKFDKYILDYFYSAI